jgi:hypothetical protein
MLTGFRIQGVMMPVCESEKLVKDGQTIFIMFFC